MDTDHPQGLSVIEEQIETRVVVEVITSRASMRSSRGATDATGDLRPTPHGITDMRIACSIHQPVSVRNYVRIRFGKVEYVRAHCRSLPRR